MRNIFVYLAVLIMLAACATAVPTKPLPVAPITLAEPAAPLNLDPRLLEDCPKVALLVRKIYTQLEVEEYNAEWLELYNKCRMRNRDAVSALRAIMDASK